MVKPIVNSKFILKKFPGKGGWTHADLPQFSQNKKVLFGWVKVKGTIDGFEISKYKLMPYGGDKLFLPVKAEIRKMIKKMEGDSVKVVLFLDNDPIEIPEELLLCLQTESEAIQFFNSLSDNEKQNYIKWIYSVKNEETKVERISLAILNLTNKKKFNSIK